MKRAILLLSTVCLLSLVVFCAGAAPDDDDDTSADIEALKKEIATLRQRVEALEKQLGERRIIIPRTPRGQVPGLTPRDYQRTPEGWQKRYFNGIPYYIIPIQERPKARARSSRR